MASAGVVAVLLPTVHARRCARRPGATPAVLREAGVELALATDCNPGTSWCESMPLRDPAGLPGDGPVGDEAFRAATLGRGAFAAARRRRAPGRRCAGDLAVLDAEHEADVVAHLGGRPVSATVVGGQVAFST